MSEVVTLTCLVESELNGCNVVVAVVVLTARSQREEKKRSARKLDRFDKRFHFHLPFELFACSVHTVDRPNSKVEQTSCQRVSLIYGIWCKVGDGARHSHCLRERKHGAQTSQLTVNRASISPAAVAATESELQTRDSNRLP